MNLDDIKSTWQNESDSDIKIPESVAGLKSAHAPVERIRKNMKNELYAQIIAIIIMGFIPFHFKFRPEFMGPFYASYAILIAISFYYLLRFYFFYKRITDNSLSSKENLYALYYDIRLNIEMYKSFSYSLVPFILIFIGIVALNLKKFENVSLHTPQVVLVASGLYIFIMVVMGLATVSWIKYFYGRYIRQIKGLLDQLKEE
jgi:hypothetical protein